MLQHLLLLLIIPPLILLSLTPAPVPQNFETGRWQWLNWILRRPLANWFLGVGGMWLWHAPTLCNAAVSNAWVHRLQYVSLLAMGFAFWWPIIGPWTRQRLAPLAGMIYLFSACLGCTVLGIIITFSPVEVCSIYLHPVDRLGILPLIQNQWGLTPAKDQQLGGLLMWVPACLIYFFGILGSSPAGMASPATKPCCYPRNAKTLLEKLMDTEISNPNLPRRNCRRMEYPAAKLPEPTVWPAMLALGDHIFSLGPGHLTHHHRHGLASCLPRMAGWIRDIRHERSTTLKKFQPAARIRPPNFRGENFSRV
jgi:hypothetical protein